MNGATAAPAPRPADAGPAGAAPNYRATSEDYFLWVVIVGVIAYLGWYLSWGRDTLTSATDVGRMALVGMNMRANLQVMIGAVTILVGCMLVLRRVQVGFSGHAAYEGARARIVADSAGIVVTALGVILLIIVAMNPPTFRHAPGASAPAVGDAADSRSLKQVLDDVRARQAAEASQAGSGKAVIE